MTTIKIDAGVLEKIAAISKILDKQADLIKDRCKHGEPCNSAMVIREMKNHARSLRGITSTAQPQPEVTAESEYWRVRALTAEARYQSSVKILTNIAGYLKPENIQTPDGQTYEFNPSDAVVRQHWDGLTKHIRSAIRIVRGEGEK